MKAVLVFPPFPLGDRYSEKVKDVGGHLVPLGISYLAAVLEKAGVEVKIIDAAPKDLDEETVAREALALEPDFVGITALTPSFKRVIKICRLLKKRQPNVFLAVGGPHASLMPEETLKQTGADVVFVGEGENIIVELVKNCRKPVKQRIAQGSLVKDLNALPFPARHLLDMSVYSSLPNNYKVDKKVINMMTSRGCPFKCSFCSKGVAGRTYRQRSVENVIAEIKHVIKEYGTKEIAFWDDVITVNRKWMMDFCAALHKENLKIAWACETRAQLVDLEMLKAMKKAGCWNIFYGIEAGDQRLLDNICKQETLEDMRRGVKLTKQAGIEIRGSFMIGLPGETPELARKTIEFAIELDPDYAQFSLTTPYPGTELFKDAEKYGKLNKNFDQYSLWNVAFVPYGYKSEEELRETLKLAFRRFYFRPKYVIRRILKIRSLSEIKRNFLGLKVILGLT